MDHAPIGTLTDLATVAATADPDSGSAAVAWQDTRFGSGSKTEVFVAATIDGGNTWNETQLSSGGILGLAPEGGSLELVSDEVGPSYRFELTGMGPAPLAAVVLSGSTGSLPVGFGDPRDLGLAVDAWLISSLHHAFGVLGASLTGGAGATPAIPGTLPRGLGIHAAAFSFDLAGGVTIGEITDVHILP